MRSLFTIIILIFSNVAIADVTKPILVSSPVIFVRTFEVDHVPTFIKDVCSGAAINVDGKQMICTAAHCLLNLEKAHQIELLTDASSTFYGLIYKAENKISVPTADFHIYPFHDVACVSSKLSQEYKVDFRRPKLGSIVTVVGYPDGFGPKNIRCTYAGPAVTFNQDSSSFSIQDMAECPKEDLRGTSGGVVLNEENLAIGVFVSQHMQKSNSTTIFFSSYATLKRIGTAYSEELSVRDPFSMTTRQAKVSYRDNGAPISITVEDPNKSKVQFDFQTDPALATFTSYDPKGKVIKRSSIVRGKFTKLPDDK